MHIYGGFHEKECRLKEVVRLMGFYVILTKSDKFCKSDRTKERRLGLKGKVDTWVKLMEVEDYFRKVCYADITWCQFFWEGGLLVSNTEEGGETPSRMEIYVLLLSIESVAFFFFLYKLVLF